MVLGGVFLLGFLLWLGHFITSQNVANRDEPPLAGEKRPVPSKFEHSAREGMVYIPAGIARLGASERGCGRTQKPSRSSRQDRN